jgi:hypothetical protein
MSELQTISVTVGILTACITVIIGILSFLKSNRQAEKERQIEIDTRQAQLLMQLYDRYNDARASGDSISSNASRFQLL